MFGSKILHIFLISAFLISSTTRKIKVHCNCINGPKNVECSEGDDAVFMWNNTCGRRIISATFGIKKDNIADPQLINVDIVDRKIHFNRDMYPKYKGRVNFTGNLAVGFAWFILKNLTMHDCKWYIASISDEVTRILPYPVHLIVRKKETRRGMTFKSIPSISNTTNHKNTSIAATTVATPSIYTGAKKSSSTTNKTFSSAFIILIAMLI